MPVLSATAATPCLHDLHPPLPLARHTAAGQSVKPCCRMGKPALGGGLVLPKLTPQHLQSLSSTNSPAGRELRGDGASQAAATQVATPEPAWLVSLCGWLSLSGSLPPIMLLSSISCAGLSTPRWLQTDLKRRKARAASASAGSGAMVALRGPAGDGRPP